MGSGGLELRRREIGWVCKWITLLVACMLRYHIKEQSTNRLKSSHPTLPSQTQIPFHRHHETHHSPHPPPPRLRPHNLRLRQLRRRRRWRSCPQLRRPYQRRLIQRHRMQRRPQPHGQDQHGHYAPGGQHGDAKLAPYAHERAE